MRTALLFGYTHHVQAIAGFVSEHATRWRIVPCSGDRAGRNRALALLPFVDAVLEFGGPAPDALIAAAARRLQKPVAVIWAGTDLVKLRDDPREIAYTRARRQRHVACSAALADELCDLGIPAKELRLVVARPPASIAPLPARFSVLAYAQRDKGSLYGMDVVLAAAQSLPSVRFDIIGVDGSYEGTPDNVDFRGWIDDVEEAIDAATVLLRPTRHDGMPLMVVDALARGRYVIWSYPLEGASFARTPEEVVAQIAALEAAHRAGTLSVNSEGMKSAGAAFAPAAIASGVEDFLDELGASYGAGRAPRRRRAVASGEPESVAAFIDQAASEAPEWDIHPLLGRSRSERFDDVLSVATCERWFNLGGPAIDSAVKSVARAFGKKPTSVNYVPGRVLNGTLRSGHRARNRMKLSPCEWRAFDECHPAPTFFARPAWGLALERAPYGLLAEPTLFSLPEGEAIFPFMRSGRRFVSIEAMPLGAYSLPLRLDGQPAEESLAAAIVRDIIQAKSDNFSCTFWPLAGYNGIGDQCERRPYQTSIIDLRDGADAALARFKGVARRMAGQAVRKGVTCGREPGGVDVYYRLLEDAARRWGYAAPHIPRRLLEAVVELGGDDVEVWIARYGGEAIAGGVLLYGSSEAFFWTAALRAEYGELRPSNLLNTEMIKAAAERGIQWYNMGASEGLEGVARFKESLGAQLYDYASLSWRSTVYRAYCRLRSFVAPVAQPQQATG